MKKNKLVLIVASSLFIFSCGESKVEDEKKEEKSFEISPETMEAYRELGYAIMDVDNELIKVRHLNHFTPPDSTIYKIDSLASEILKLDKASQKLIAVYSDSLKSEIDLANEIDEMNDEKNDEWDDLGGMLSDFYMSVDDKKISEEDLKKEIVVKYKLVEEFKAHCEKMYKMWEPIARQQKAVDSLLNAK